MFDFDFKKLREQREFQDKMFNYFFAGLLILILGFLGGALYVAIHFLAKVW